MFPSYAPRSLRLDTGLIEAMEALIAWLESVAREDLRGGFVSPDSVGVRIETLYFDAPKVTSWPAFALGRDESLLAVGPDLVFVPEASDG